MKFSAIFLDSSVIHYLPASFEHLYELKLVSKDVATNHSTDFIRMNKKLRRFELIFEQLGDSYCNIDGENITQLAKELTELEIAVIHTTSLSAQVMLQFLFDCKLLKQLTVRIVRDGFMCFVEEYLDLKSIEKDINIMVQSNSIKNDWNLQIMYENVDGVWKFDPQDIQFIQSVKFQFNRI